MGSFYGKDGTLYSGRVKAELTGRNVSVIKLNKGDSTSIVAGGSKTIQVTPPVGKLWKVPLVWSVMPSPQGATTGTVKIEINLGSSDYRYLVLRAASNFGDMARIMSNIAETATNSSLPSDVNVQQKAIQNLVFTNSTPMFVTFYNSTDVDLTTSTELNLVIQEEGII